MFYILVVVEFLPLLIKIQHIPDFALILVTYVMQAVPPTASLVDSSSLLLAKTSSIDMIVPVGRYWALKGKDEGVFG